MNLILTSHSSLAAVITKFIIGRNFWGEAGVFVGEPSPPPPPPPPTHTTKKTYYFY